MSTLKDRLLSRTYICDDGCWYCDLGGENSRYGSIWYGGQNIGNHQASWIVHKGPIPEGKCVLHSCDYKRCINPDHLFLGTLGDNNTDRKDKGRNADRKGENNHCAKFSENDIREIRRLCNEGYSQTWIAEQYNTAQSVISQIKTGARWSHVE